MKRNIASWQKKYQEEKLPARYSIAQKKKVSGILLGREMAVEMVCQEEKLPAREYAKKKNERRDSRLLF